MTNLTPTEYITIEPPIWCQRCNRQLTGVVRPDADGYTALCADCAATARPVDMERRSEDARPIRDLVTLARLMSWRITNDAAEAAAQGRPGSADILLDLANATNRAIERLRGD